MGPVDEQCPWVKQGLYYHTGQVHTGTFLIQYNNKHVFYCLKLNFYKKYIEFRKFHYSELQRFSGKWNYTHTYKMLSCAKCQDIASVNFGGTVLLDWKINRRQGNKTRYTVPLEHSPSPKVWYWVHWFWLYTPALSQHCFLGIHELNRAL